MTMTWRDSFRLWRRNLKAALPYVRRREHRIVQRKYEELIDGMGWNAPPATAAQITTLKPVVQPLAGEVCFFVTFAARPQLKHHVRVHIEHMLRACRTRPARKIRRWSDKRFTDGVDEL